MEFISCTLGYPRGVGHFLTFVLQNFPHIVGVLSDLQFIQNQAPPMSRGGVGEGGSRGLLWLVHKKNNYNELIYYMYMH